MAVLELPVLVTRFMFENIWREANGALYDQPTWDEAKAAQAALGLKWAVRFLPTKFSDFLRLASRQGNADIFQAGGLWVYKWKARRDPVLAITERTMVALPRFSRTPPRTALAIKFQAQWDQNYATGEWRSAKTITSPTADRMPPAQRGRNLVTNQQTSLDMPYIADAATADYIARSQIGQSDHQRWHVSVSTDWDALIAEKGDSITVDAAVLLQSLGSLRGTFVVQSKTYDPATDSILLEADQADLAVLAIPGSMAVRGSTTFTMLGSLSVAPLLTVPGSLFVRAGGYWGGAYFGKRYFGKRYWG